MANINKIRLSGTTYNLQDSNATKTVELTQAQYDALSVKDPNTFYIITDAQGADLSQYYTSAQTESAITQAVSGKQDTLVSGTNIKTINNESILGSGNITIEGGGGASYSAGTGIDITNDVISVTGKVDTTTYETYTAATATAIGDKLATSDFNTYSGTVDTAINSKASQSDLNTLSGTVTAHTANTDIHVTTAQTAAWNAKSDFSGSYNDLTNKLSAGTNISIVDNVISAEGGGGKAIEAGRGISVTTGATADTVSFNLPIYSGTGEGSIIGGFSGNTASGKYSIALGGRYENIFDYQYCKASGKGAISFGGTASGQGAFSCGENPQALGFASVAFGDSTKAIGVESFVIGRNTTANTFVSFAQGKYTKTTNEAEVALGEYNNSVSSSSTWGDSGNTLFSVGNGTADNARHNAFEIRQNGDIYITSGGTDIKLQDNLGGGGSSYTAGTGIDITNDVISVSGVVMSSEVTSAVTSGSTDVVTSGGVYDQLGGMKIVKLTESEYAALVTKDSNTLYCVVPDPSN